MNFLKFQNIIFELLFKKLLKRWIEREFIPNNYVYFLDCNKIKNWGHEHNAYFEKLNYFKSILQATMI